MWVLYDIDEVEMAMDIDEVEVKMAMLPMYEVVSKHGIHLTLLAVDASLNKIHVEYNQWSVTAMYTIGYNLTLIVAWLGFNQMVYPFATYDSLFSWSIVLGLLVLTTSSHLLFYVVAKQRNFQTGESF